MKTPYQTLFLIILFITGIPFLVDGNRVHPALINPLVPEEIDNPGVFSLINHNVLGTVFDEWKSTLIEENADIMVLVETGRWKLSDGTFDQAVIDVNALFPGEKPYEAVSFEPEATTDGQAIFSRFPIKESNALHDYELDDGTVYRLSHQILYAKLDINGIDVYIVTMHLTCCTDNRATRIKEQEAINNFMDDLGNVPIIYTGDLNSHSPEINIIDPENNNLESDPMDMLLNSSDPRTTKIHTWIDVYRTLNPDIDQYPGFTYIDVQFKSRIDFIMVNQNLAKSIVSSVNIPTSVDHSAITAIFNLNYETLNLRPPLPPSGIAIDVDVGNTQSTISWNLNTEDDFFKYQLWRNKCLITEIANPTLSFVDNYFYEANTIYLYELRSVDNTDNISPLSSKNYINTSQGNLAVPGQPIVSASTVSGGIAVNWPEPSTGGTPIIRYEIFRSPTDTQPGFPAGVTAETSIIDTSISRAGIRLFYQVKAYNLVGDGWLSKRGSAISGFMAGNTIQTLESNSLVGHGLVPTEEPEDCPSTITTLEYTPPISTTNSTTLGVSDENDSSLGLPIFSLLFVNIAVLILRKRKY